MCRKRHILPNFLGTARFLKCKMGGHAHDYTMRLLCGICNCTGRCFPAYFAHFSALANTYTHAGAFLQLKCFPAAGMLSCSCIPTGHYTKMLSCIWNAFLQLVFLQALHKNAFLQLVFLKGIKKCPTPSLPAWSPTAVLPRPYLA